MTAPPSNALAAIVGETRDVAELERRIAEAIESGKLSRADAETFLDEALASGGFTEADMEDALGWSRKLVTTALVGGEPTKLYRTRTKERGALGSHIKEFEEILRGSLFSAARLHVDGKEVLPKHIIAVWAAIQGLEPKSELEGMLAAQMVATHEAAMSCFQIAASSEQRSDVRDRELSQANRLVRSYASLVAALDKHRGKGQQTVRVEHVHVHQGGQAIVGNVSHDSRRREGEVAAEAVLGGGGTKDDD